jgi:hypothetical protein
VKTQFNTNLYVHGKDPYLLAILFSDFFEVKNEVSIFQRAICNPDSLLSVRWWPAYLAALE